MLKGSRELNHLCPYSLTATKTTNSLAYLSNKSSRLLFGCLFGPVQFKSFNVFFPAYASTKSTYLQLEAKMFKETLDGKVSNRVPLELEAVAPRAAPQSVPKRRLPTV